MLQSNKVSAGARLVVAGAAALALTACSSSDDDAPDEAAASASASPSSSPSASPSEVQTSATASVPDSPSTESSDTAATGPLIAVGTASFRAPDGWIEAGGISTEQNSARRPGGGGVITVSDMESLGSAVETLAQVTLENAPKGATRLPDTTLGDDGTVAAQLTWKEGGNTTVRLIATRAGRTINLAFTLRPSDLKADPDLVESVLDSWQWVDGGSS